MHIYKLNHKYILCIYIYFKLISYKVMWEEGIKRWIKRLANRKNQPGIWNQSIGKREIEK